MGNPTPPAVFPRYCAVRLLLVPVDGIWSGCMYATMSLIIPCTKDILDRLEKVCPEISAPKVSKLHEQLESLAKDRLLAYEQRRPVTM